MVNNIDKLDENRRWIEEYKQNGQKYRIWIEFYGINSSVDDKMKMLNMIYQLGVNHKVKEIWIKLCRSNEFSQQLI